MTVLRTPWPPKLASPIEVAPLGARHASLWLVLGRSGELTLFDADGGTSSEKMTIALPEEPTREPWNGHAMTPQLHASADGRFAAIANDFGQRGLVVDLERRAVTMELDGQDEDCETVPFSLAFFDIDGACRLVHRTAWNRLDISDPATGTLLTDRGPTSSGHDLDYYHGRLEVSPDGAHVLDDGWVWHPAGIPTVWSLRRWLRENPWESEVGPSRCELAIRTHYWNHGMCWGSPRWFALAGIGDDDDTIVDGALIFELDDTGSIPMVDGRARHRAFAGPAGNLFGDGDRLFSSDPTGLSIWDIGDGARVQHVPSFCPTRHHRAARELAQITADALLRFRY
ncbi:hypothetical protein LZC95_03120 [Pendulispora brunnea]|uniref:WD40 repeat domain-containing protein n=1 Tax=Pendulispora brunnea TaxID=2905690 RepID=A0ABZ2KB26_9BACT